MNYNPNYRPMPHQQATTTAEEAAPPPSPMMYDRYRRHRQGGGGVLGGNGSIYRQEYRNRNLYNENRYMDNNMNYNSGYRYDQSYGSRNNSPMMRSYDDVPPRRRQYRDSNQSIPFEQRRKIGRAHV